MNRHTRRGLRALTIALTLGTATIIGLHAATDNVAEEVAWVVGDEPIWKSDIEEAYMQMLYERIPISGDPYCVIPETIAIEKLYLHQADIDTVEVQSSMVAGEVERRLNYYINSLGSREKVEETFRKPLPEIREQLTDLIMNSQRVAMVQDNLTSNIKTTPSLVNRYFESLPQDSVPFIPMQVETQILTIQPVIPRQEIDDIKARLREFTDRVNSGETEFSTLAILYSQDPGSASRGGELGFMGRGQMVTEYASAAFNLNDPKKISPIVETEFGFHIIQLIEKRGDRVNTRHILLQPRVSDKDLMDAIHRLDTLRTDIVDNKKFTFEEAVNAISQDKDTRFNSGRMMNQNTGSTRFRMDELPQEVAREVSSLQPGEISKPFIMKDPKSNRDIVALVKLSERLDAHQANVKDDYQTILGMYQQAQRQRILDDWLEQKIANTYIRIEDGWKNCNFKYKWVKERSSTDPAPGQ